MKRTALVGALVMLVTAAATVAHAQSVDDKIAQAVKALPESMREGASVVEYDADGYRTILREGTNALVCEPDDPNTDGFRVSCYHQNRIARLNFERQLAATGMAPMEVFKARSAKVDAGELPLPMAGQVGYFLGGGDDEASAVPTRSVRLPYATSESTGLPTERGEDGVWLMQAGTNRAHIMIVGHGRETAPVDMSDKIAQAVSPLPESMRAGASVVEYDTNGERHTLREGTNSLVCEPDGPAEGFFAYCYHEGHVIRENFERKLAATGLERMDVFRQRITAVEAGKIPLPVPGQMQYLLSGDDAGHARPGKGVRLPYATSQSTGMPTEDSSDHIWIMQAGTNRAHIMLPGR